MSDNLLQRGLNDWNRFDDGKSLGTKGSEDGEILRDEEHRAGARITLEKCGRIPFTITCGLYGWMCHTRFFGDLDTASSEFESMKPALSDVLSLIPTVHDMDVDRKRDKVCDAISQFVDKFPI